MKRNSTSDTRRRRRAVPKRTPTDVGLGKLLRKAHMAFGRAISARLADFGISYGQFQHLRELWVENGLNPLQISQRIGIMKSSSTAILESLEKAKLVYRVQDKEDRRKVLILLTPAGAALKDDLRACAKAANSVARRNLSDADVARLFDMLELLSENLLADCDGRDPSNL